MDSTHTPTPWILETPKRAITITSRDIAICEGDDMVAFVRVGTTTREEDESKAERIVRACNAHGLLVSAAKEALEFIEKRTPGIVIDAKDALRIAIAKAEGK